jgi:hypothetical protein
MRINPTSNNQTSIETNTPVIEVQTPARDPLRDSSLIALQNAEYPQQECCLTASISLLCQDFFSWLADFISDLFCCSNSGTEEERELRLQIRSFRRELGSITGQSAFDQLPEAARNYILDRVYLTNESLFKQTFKDGHLYQPQNRRNEVRDCIFRNGLVARLISRNELNTTGLDAALTTLSNTPAQAGQLAEEVAIQIDQKIDEERQAAQTLKGYFEGTEIVPEAQFLEVFSKTSTNLQKKLLNTVWITCQSKVSNIYWGATYDSDRSTDERRSKAMDDAALRYMKTAEAQGNVELNADLLKTMNDYFKQFETPHVE